MSLIEKIREFKTLLVLTLVIGIIQIILQYLTISNIYPYFPYIIVNYLFAVFIGCFAAYKKLSPKVLPSIIILYSTIISLGIVIYGIFFAVYFWITSVLVTLIISVITYIIIQTIIKILTSLRVKLQAKAKFKIPIQVKPIKLPISNKPAFKVGALIPQWLKRKSKINLIDATKLIIFNPKKLFETVKDDPPISTIIFLLPLIILGATELILTKGYFKLDLTGLLIILMGVAIHFLFYIIVPFVCMVILAIMKVENKAPTVYNPIIYGIAFAYAFSAIGLIFVPLISMGDVVLMFLTRILVTVIRAALVLWGFIIAVNGLSQLNKTTKVKSAIVLIIAIGIGTLIILQIVQSATYTYRATFEKSELLKEQTLKEIKRLYGEDAAEAIEKLANHIVEEEADAFMGYSPRLIEVYGKEDIKVVAEIAEKYALLLDGEAVETLIKLTNKYSQEKVELIVKRAGNETKNILRIARINNLEIDIATIGYLKKIITAVGKDAAEGIVKVTNEISKEAGAEKANKVSENTLEILSDTEYRWSSEAAEGLVKTIAKEGIESEIIKNISKLKNVKGIDRYVILYSTYIENGRRQSDIDELKYEAELNTKLLDNGYEIEEVSIPAKDYKLGNWRFDSVVITPDKKRIVIKAEVYANGTYLDQNRYMVTYGMANEMQSYKAFAQKKGIKEVWIVFRKIFIEEIREALKTIDGIKVKQESEITASLK